MSMPVDTPAAPLTAGELIRAGREAAHLTQEALAREIPVSSITVSRWERNLIAPGEPHRRRFAELVGRNRAERQRILELLNQACRPAG